MRIDAPLLEGRFLRRYKRFFADVELDDGSVVTAHCPNTGSLQGCKVEGARAWLRDSQDDKRKLRFSWQAIQIGKTWVNVDTNLPNRAVRQWVEQGKLPELEGYASVRPEVKYGTNSRIDLLLEDDARPPCYVEIKNTTLSDGRTAMFPDAVTSRGLKHLGELIEVVESGSRAVQFFFVSRNDVDRFRPADSIDPAYSARLREAAQAGVEVVAYSVQVRRDGLRPAEALEVDLS
ncbi:MAG: DNA/RNA nuclease SfsA [Planctomycetota bacterium]|jgi:sugar fermentation stimulation protein A